MKIFMVRYWANGATIGYVYYKAKDENGAAAKFHRYRLGQILGIEEA